MNPVAKGSAVIVAAIFSTLAGAAEPAASSAPARGGAMAMSSATSDTARDIKAQKNNRLQKCGGMNGDERKACRADAKAMAQAARKDAASERAHGSGGAAKN